MKPARRGAPKLTEVRRKHLEAVRDFKVRRYQVSDGGFSWYTASRVLRPSTMKWLLDNGLIRLEKEGGHLGPPLRATLTDAGRDALRVEVESDGA